FERAPESKTKRALALRPVAADAPDFARRLQSVHSTVPCSQARSIQTCRTPSTRMPIHAERLRQGFAARILWFHLAARSESLHWNRSLLASSSRSFRNHLCQFRFRANFSPPFHNGPGLPPRRLP